MKEKNTLHSIKDVSKLFSEDTLRKETIEMILTPKIRLHPPERRDVEVNSYSLQTHELTFDPHLKCISSSKKKPDILKMIPFLKAKPQQCLYYSNNHYWKNPSVSPLRKIQKVFMDRPTGNGTCQKVEMAAAQLSHRVKLYPQTVSGDRKCVSPGAPIKVRKVCEKITLSLPKSEKPKLLVLGGRKKNIVMQKIVPRICTPEPICTGLDSPNEFFPKAPKSAKEECRLKVKRARPSTELEKKKWYDVRPRLMLNKYYRNNFAGTAKEKQKAGKNKIPLTLAHLWKSVDFASSITKDAGEDYYLRSTPGIREQNTKTRSRQNIKSQEGVQTVKCILDFY